MPTMQDIATQLMSQALLDDRSNQADAEDTAIDAAARLLGLVAGQFLGSGPGVRIQGADTETDRLAALHPASEGGGILHRAAGYGSVNPRSSLIKAGRLATNDDDYLEVFSVQRGAGPEGSWANQASGFYVHPVLRVNVPCPVGVSTLLFGIAGVEVRPGLTTSLVHARITIGPESTSSSQQSTRNRTAAQGVARSRYGREDMSPLHPMHWRVMVPSGTAGASVNVPCAVRMNAQPSATTNNKIGTAWLLILRAPI